MHVEFAHLLHSALKNLTTRVESNWSKLLAEDDLLDFRWDKLFVESAPVKIPADITSSVVFKLAEKTGADTASRPADLAQELISKLAELDSKKYFNLSLGGQGHINIVVANNFRNDFFKKAFQLEKPALLQSQSLVFQEQSNIVFPRLIINWEECISRALELADPDVLTLMSAYKSGRFSQEELRMTLLACLSDGEFSIQPFLGALAGRENIPWYFKRFFNDCERFLKFCSVDTRDFGDIQTPKSMQVLEKNALIFRERLFTAGRLNKPELFFGHLVEMIRAFYAVFNRPEYRNILSTRVPDEQIYWLRSQIVLFKGNIQKACKEVFNFTVC